MIYRSNTINSYVVPQGTEVSYWKLGSDSESERLAAVLKEVAISGYAYGVQKIYALLLKKEREISYLIVVDAECDEYEELFRNMNRIILRHGKLSYPIDYCPWSKPMEDDLMDSHIDAVWSRD